MGQSFKMRQNSIGIVKSCPFCSLKGPREYLRFLRWHSMGPHPSVQQWLQKSIESKIWKWQSRLMIDTRWKVKISWLSYKCFNTCPNDGYAIYLSNSRVNLFMYKPTNRLSKLTLLFPEELLVFVNKLWVCHLFTCIQGL